MHKEIAALAVAALVALPAGAWTLEDETSAISYVTIKNGEVAEPNLLSGLRGSVAEDGAANVEVLLSSVETYIDIRNERMREILFKVADFPVATITAQLDMAALADLAPGESRETGFALTVAANGQESSYDAMALVTRAGENRVIVSSVQPIIVYADELGYSEGVAQLQEIAGLDSIQPAVPVSFTLSFAR